MIWLIMLIIPVNCYYLLREMWKIEQRQVEREKIFEKWIFDSLYSINNKVLLPEEHEKPTIEKKATVYVPSKDPMAEFNGNQDDWHE